MAAAKRLCCNAQSWYPDGTHLMAHRVYGWSSDLNPSLYKLSILGGEPQEIVSDAWGGSVSPDGSRIAYLPVTNRGDLWIMDADGANPRKIVSGPEANKGALGRDLIFRVVWSPNGQHLATSSSITVTLPILSSRFARSGWLIQTAGARA